MYANNFLANTFDFKLDENTSKGQVLFLKIGIISDTHGYLREEAAACLSDCDFIIHAGDIDDAVVLDRLNSIAKTYAVRGNADKGIKSELQQQLAFTIDGVNFQLAHNKKTIGKPLENTHIAVYGHTHRYAQVTDSRGVLWLNPGYCGRHRLNQKITMAIVQTDRGSFTVNKILLEDKEKNGREQELKDNLLPKIRYIVDQMDKNRPMDKIAAKLGVSQAFVETIYRIRVTHPGVDCNGILDKLEVNEVIKKEFL